VKCWDSALGKPAAVEIATSGHWNDRKFGLKGGLGADFNHAKLGVSISGDGHYAIFGDLNQQGTLSGAKCESSQNGRGGLFYVIESKDLSTSISDLIDGETASTRGVR
jgi:hypothetical protein